MGVARRADVLWRTAGGYLAVCTPSGRCVEVGGSAAAVWAALPTAPAAPVPLAELVHLLACGSNAHPAEVEPVVHAVLEVLESHGCVVRAA